MTDGDDELRALHTLGRLTRGALHDPTEQVPRYRPNRSALCYHCEHPLKLSACQA